MADTAAAGGEVYRLASDARYARAGGDGSVFVLTGVRKPTPGAWIQECNGLADSLSRMDAKTGTVLWSTCLPVRAESLTVDAGGAVTMAGAPSRSVAVRATPGAYASPGAGGIVVIRLNPAGSAPEWIATIRGNPGYPAVRAAWTAAGPDGSVYGAATVITGILPVTETALQSDPRGSAYFFRLSADGSTLKYATYLTDVAETSATDLVADGAGNVFVGGTCGFSWFDHYPSMATPGAFTTGRNRWATSAWVARFDPAASAFRYVSVFGSVGFRIALASAGRGRVAIAGLGASGALTPTAGAFVADRNAHSGAYESFVVVLNPEGSAPEVVASYGLGSVRALESDGDGNLIVAGEASEVATTADAWRPVGGAAYDTGYLLKLAADGGRVLYATGLGCRTCEVRSLTRAGDTLWIALSDESQNLALGAAQPVTVRREEISMLRATPDNWHEVLAFPRPVLSWDTRDRAVASAEIRLGAPNGPVVARGTTGAMALDGQQTATYYFVDTTKGPSGGHRVLGVETFTRNTTLGVIPIENAFWLWLDPNPVLSCREAPLTGTETRIQSIRAGGDGLVEVRVGSPAGPATTAGMGSVNQVTEDWVRNGMSFYILGAAENKVYASVRAFLLPNRSCRSAAPPVAMIRATRDCVRTDRFTLAWYAGAAPVEIREGSAAGPKVARFARDSGLYDVTVTAAKTYWLLSWQDGGWKPIASTVADPGARCEQGAVQ